MDKREASAILERAQNTFGSSERTNFKNVWERSAFMCKPYGNTILGQRTAGEEKSVNRILDKGIQSLGIFTSGVTSTLVPKGTKYFEYKQSRTSRVEKTDEMRDWYSKCTEIANDFIDESNFFNEITKAFADLGCIGTTLFLTEPDPKTGLRFKTYYIEQFSFMENANGEVDTAFFKYDLSVRQLAQKFGVENLSDCMKRALEKSPDDKFKIYHSIYPRLDYTPNTVDRKKMEFASVYISEEGEHVLEESGYNELPASVCRWSQATNEIYGRSPADGAHGNMSMANTMYYSLVKSAQRLSNPSWLIPNNGSVEGLSNRAGSIITYNPTTAGEPKQITQKDMPQMTEQLIRKAEDDIAKAFFVDKFQPFEEMGSRATAQEVNHRVAISNQQLVTSISRVVDELLEPTFRRIFQVLLDGGYFPDMPTGFELRDVKVAFKGRSALLTQQIDSANTMNTLQGLISLAQIDPAVMDYIDPDVVVKITAEASNLPSGVIRTDSSVRKIREGRAIVEQQNEQQKQEMMASQAYPAMTKAPEKGSPADLIMGHG